MNILFKHVYAVITFKHRVTHILTDYKLIIFCLIDETFLSDAATKIFTKVSLIRLKINS
jgi:hypothetical protein